MNDAFAVGGVNGIGDLHSEPDHLITWHRTAGHAVLQGLTLQHLHDDEGTALIIIRVVDSADMGVVQRRRCARLRLELLNGSRSMEKLLWQELKRDKP